MNSGIGESAISSSVRPVWAIFIRSFAFLRKEVVEIVRQPRLVALLVAGPFALLVMFGLGYSETTIVKKAVFVGPPGTIYEEVLTKYEGDLGEFIDSQGMVATEEEGLAQLHDGTADIVVIFPEDPVSSVIAGERAVIRLVHDEIDPIQVGTVEIAARLAIQEVNATVLTSLASEVQGAVPSSLELRVNLVALSRRLADDPVGRRDDLLAELDQIDTALNGSSTVLGRLELDDMTRVDGVNVARAKTRDVADRLQAINAETSDAELQDLGEELDSLSDTLAETVVLDPNVLVRPFENQTDDLIEGTINPTEYFTPSSLALLLQHLALTFAALSLVRDRRTGLFELMRVGPLSSIEIIVGKVFAYLLVGSVVGALLVAASVYGLSVPLLGSVGWIAVVIVGVLLASLALGMVIAILSGTESQAVQYAMLALLAGLFFSGFLLPISGLGYPVKIVSWLLPVTYGISSFQEVMLRGNEPDVLMLSGLGGLVVLYGGLAVLGLRRQLQAGAAS